MPRVVHYGSNQALEKAAAAAAQGILIGAQQQQQADRLGLARKQFEFQQEQAAIGNDQRQQQIDQGQQRIDMLSEDRAFNQSRALASDARADAQLGLAQGRDARDQERFNMQKNAANQAAAQEAAESELYRMSYRNDPDLTEEHIAVLDNTNIEHQRQAANLAEMKILAGKIRETGTLSLSALGEQLGIEDPNDEMLQYYQGRLEATNDPSYIQSTVDEIHERYNTVVDQRERLREHYAYIERTEPFITDMASTLPHDRSVALKSAFELARDNPALVGNLMRKQAEALLEKAFEADGGAGNITPQERMIQSAHSKAGTEIMKTNEYGEFVVDPVAAQERLNALDGVRNSPAESNPFKAPADRGTGGLQAQSQTENQDELKKDYGFVNDILPDEKPSAFKAANGAVVDRSTLDTFFGVENINRVISEMPNAESDRLVFAVENARRLIKSVKGDESDQNTLAVAGVLMHAYDTIQ